jgi:hypothetical protein
VKHFTTGQRSAGANDRDVISRQQAEEDNMQSSTAHAMAIAVAMVVALSSAWAASEPPFKLGMPTGPEETVYRPECPSDEVASAWLWCQIAHADGNHNRR